MKLLEDVGEIVANTIVFVALLAITSIGSCSKKVQCDAGEQAQTNVEAAR